MTFELRYKVAKHLQRWTHESLRSPSASSPFHMQLSWAHSATIDSLTQPNARRDVVPVHPNSSVALEHANASSSSQFSRDFSSIPTRDIPSLIPATRTRSELEESGSHIISSADHGTARLYLSIMSLTFTQMSSFHLLAVWQQTQRILGLERDKESTALVYLAKPPPPPK
jgi:hypothetical protein